MKQLEVLNEYYTNLDYDIDKEKALEKIRNLSKTVRFDESVHFVERLEALANIIQDNISFFKSICRHVDTIDTILEHLTNATDMISQEVSETDRIMIFNRMLYTVLNICGLPAIRLFFIHPLLNDVLPHKDSYKQISYWQVSECIVTQMIILEDSDLYAVISYLIITDKFPLHKIWVQKQVKGKFEWLMKRHYSDITAYEKILLITDTFQSLEDIQLHECTTDINIVSIWSEDIVAAKNLALSLNCHVIFINTHMEFSGGLITFPHKEIIEQKVSQQTLNKICELKSDSSDTEQSVNVLHFSHTAEMNFTSICNLFYDGTWQEPVKGMYWKHNDYLWANATNDDIIRCYESAEKGFKTWSIKPIKTRIQILSKLEPILKLTGKLVLAAIVAKWLKISYLFETVKGYSKVSRNGMIEAMHVRKPVGVIILREENENVLFFRLMQTLIAGNSVIVMFDANFCNLTSYCDMFSSCGIPPGVINLLSHEDINMLEYKLCSAKYTDYADKIFLKGNSNETYITSYKNLTTCQYIMLHFK
ncbi:uncharacterized protein [Temnothorax nylanderi]|uniref:uncharacterized protein isoform X2 n=1 Tax=Temnothorax nylanderi TaxID=102681 RepID=UPI003A8C1B5B